MAKFDFNKPVASFSWYLQNGSADDNSSIENAAQSIKELRDAGVDLDALPNLSCDECSQLAAKVIPYAENKAHRSLDRSLGHKHEVNRDAAQRMQASRENAVSMIGDHAIHM